MKGVLPVGLLCSLVAICLASGSEAQDVGSVSEVKESSVVSSFLPESPSSTFLLAFPVDDAKSNDNSEEVHAGGGGATTKMVTEEPAPAEKEGKDEEVVTVVLSDSNPKEDDKNEVMIPLQDLQPKEESKFFPPLPPFPPFTPFRSKPTYRERKFPFVPPFQKFRPTFLPPVRNFLQSLRKDPPINKIPPVSFLGAAALLRRALSSKLRMLNDIYQPPKIDKKFILPGSIPDEPTPSLRRPSMPIVLPPPEPVAFPFRRSFVLDSPSFTLPHFPLHSSLFSPPVMHPYPIAPTPFILPPSPRVIVLPPSLPSPYSIPARRVFQPLSPLPMPMYDLPLVPSYRTLPSPLWRPPMSIYDPPAFFPQQLSFPLPLPPRAPVYDQRPFIFQRLSSPTLKPLIPTYASPLFPTTRRLSSLPKPPMPMMIPLQDLPPAPMMIPLQDLPPAPMMIPLQDLPLFSTHNLSSRSPFIERSQEMVFSEPINVPSSEPPYVLQSLEHKYPPSRKGFEEEEVMFIPLEGEATNSEKPSFLYYEFDKPQDEMATPKRTLLDLLPPRGGNVHRVIHKTRIITSYKPDLSEMPANHLESFPSTFHKPTFSITDV